jgi:hypothetical protein
MDRVMWAPMGKSGQVLHAIGVVNSGGQTAVSLCGYHEPIRNPVAGMVPCVNCQETLKALVDAMPTNAAV